MRGLDHASVIHPQIAVDGANDDLARIESDADRKRHAVSVPNLIAVSPDTGLHSQRRITGAYRMVRPAIRAPNSAMIPSPIMSLTVPS